MKLIALVGKHGQGKFAMIDDENYERVSQYKWYCDWKGYAYTVTHTYLDDTKPRITSNRKDTTIYLHKFITNVSKGIQVDHEDLNKLNCQKYNLRVANNSLNHANQKKYSNRKYSSIYKGVYSYTTKDDNEIRYVSKIRVNKKVIPLGVYATEEYAGIMYDLNAIKYFGEFARTNFPRENYKGLDINAEIEKIAKARKNNNHPERKDSGITWYKKQQKWTVAIWAKGRPIYCGRYKTIEEARIVKQEMKIKYNK